MSTVMEFVANEKVTATMTLPLPSGEHFGAPVTIGIYEGDAEIWLQGDCGRLNIPLEHVPAFIKQLKRAAALAARARGEVKAVE